jgi:hypothetical protein
MGIFLLYVQALDEPHELSPTYLKNITLSLRPPETMLLKSFMPETETVSIPI